MSSILHPRPINFKFYKHSMKFVAALSVLGEWPPALPAAGGRPAAPSQVPLSRHCLPSSPWHRLQRLHPPLQPGEPQGPAGGRRGDLGPAWPWLTVPPARCL